MRQIKNQNLAQLLMQLRFSPQKQRRKQLDAAERLYGLIDKDKEYPFEFVSFHITGFRPDDTAGQQIIKGDELTEDLRTFIAKLSGQFTQSVAEQNQKVYTIDELAKTFSVSAKTVQRWRKQGLIARKFIFADGEKRLGFLKSTVDAFIQAHPDFIDRAKKFTRLTKKQKQQIIKLTASLASRTPLSRYRIIEQVAAKLGKVHETVRYTILNYEKTRPDKPIFKKPSGVVNQAQAGELYKLFKEGCSVEELIKRFNRSKSSIYRIINRRRASELLSRKIEFIASDEFLKNEAKEIILANIISSYKPALRKTAAPLKLAGGSLDKYLQTVKSAPLLNREREVELFRRYNYLKYLASMHKASVKPQHVSSARINEIESYLAEAEAIKKMIIESNLRIVVGIAGKHADSDANLLDLISEGNFSLMRAVEKFDYTRGFRFSTYASWAISKDFARKIPIEKARPDKASTASLEDVQRDLRIANTADFAAVERAHRSLVQVIRDNLDQREQCIILNHFGLLGSSVKKQKKTLKQIGEELTLSKERVRQIELIALQKLRHSLSPEEFDLLTG